jgi:FAD/FMN-containing dehydrogenase
MIRALQPHLDAAADGLVLAMVAEPFLPAFDALVREFGGTVLMRAAEGQGPYNAPIYEFAWGHTRLHANRTHPEMVTTVGLYVGPGALEAIARTHHRLRDTAGMHFEVKRFDGQLGFQGMPLFPYVDEAQLGAVMRGMADDGAQVANNHTFLVKEGGMKSVDDADAAFKRRMDPHGLMNPGKLRFDAPKEATGAALPSEGWQYRRAA